MESFPSISVQIVTGKDTRMKRVCVLVKSDDVEVIKSHISKEQLIEGITSIVSDEPSPYMEEMSVDGFGTSIIELLPSELEIKMELCGYDDDYTAVVSLNRGR
jgi:hypothetical protein